MAGDVTYAQAKTAMAAVGLPVSAGSDWTGVDCASWEKFAQSAQYGAQKIDHVKPFYWGFAFAGEMPAKITAAVDADLPYVATLAGTPLTGEAGQTSIAWTVTETSGAATSYDWDFGDGTTKTSSNKTETHQYAAAGSYTAKVTPHVGPVTKPQITAAAPAVISAAYSATLAGSPLTGTAGTTSITWTATESNVPAGATKSYDWDFGDGQTSTTAVPTASHTYAAAGSYSAKVTPTINGTARTQVTAAAPAVIS